MVTAAEATDAAHASAPVSMGDGGPRLRIAHVTATFPPYLAGTGRVVLNNARGLAALGHQVDVITARIPGKAPIVPGVRVRRQRVLIRIGNAPLLPRLLDLHDVDLIHLHYPFIFGAESVTLASRVHGIPMAVTFHNALIAGGTKGRLFRAYDWLWGERVLDHAARIFVPTFDGMVGPLIDEYLPRHRDRFVEVPNGVDIDAFRPTPRDEQLRASLGIPPDAPILIFVGRMDDAHHPKGGVPVLFEALRTLRHATTHVILVGGGNRVPHYKQLALELGMAGRVRFVGEITDPELPLHVALADIAVQPSQEQETFGIASVEAMACGRPVITSELPGVRTVIRRTGGGVLIPPGDAALLATTIDDLLDDAPRREELGQTGRRNVVERYAWPAIARQLEGEYRTILRETRS
jgi:glycosyltransferase involved in cell wall biosynthesis